MTRREYEVAQAHADPTGPNEIRWIFVREFRSRSAAIVYASRQKTRHRVTSSGGRYGRQVEYDTGIFAEVWALAPLPGAKESA